ncbi:MAG: site-2 protease family protein [Actinomycetota bacterium]
MGDLNLIDLVSNLIIYMVVLLLAISAHEAAHAWMSYKYGDDTAYLLGRVTLNPVAHTDPVGTLLLPILSFILGAMGGGLARIPLIGWGKPTPVNPNKWKKYKQANVMVSIAGILANLLLAAIGFTIFKILISYDVFNFGTARLGLGYFMENQEGFPKILAILFLDLIFLNVSLAIFNLLPFPPLDGSKVLSTFLPASFKPFFDLMEQFGFIILMALIYFGVVSLIMTPVFRLVQYLLITPWF